MRSLRRCLTAWSAAAFALVPCALVGQHPVPAGEAAGTGPPSPPAWLQRGDELLRREDPMAAWRQFRDAEPRPAEALDRELGLGRAHLLLGHAEFALAYGEHAVAAAPGRQDAMALTIRGLIRARRFDEAVRRSRSYLQRVAEPAAMLWSARGSALFRVQRPGDAADAYRRVIALDGRCAEAHLRLGSGLLEPRTVEIPVELRQAVQALTAGDRERAVGLLQAVLERSPGHPIAHRLLGETLFALRTASSMAMQDEAFRGLAAAMPKPDVGHLPIAQFVTGYGTLSAERRAVVDRTAALFASKLGKLVAVGGHHDLLHELERTTDAEARRSLRGRRTFDGRVWDDVRGVGGIRAATGIEALDEAATFGFDTFAHEVAHQVHFFAFTPLQRARIRSLYKAAMSERRCLDYYAASNEAEYFGQGVEAFVSLAKRPGGETTHGHTRFELYRVDPALHDFLAALVDFDPLADEAVRDDLLAHAVRVALRCGRPDDALCAAEMMSPGDRRTDLLLRAIAAREEQRSR